MGYAYGTEWNDELIKDKILGVVSTLNISYFPTKKEIDKTTGSFALSNKVSKSGGSKYWAARLDLPLKNSETNIGRENEFVDISLLENLGYKIFKTPPNHSCDFIVNDYVRVDSKLSNLHEGKNGSFFSFNLYDGLHDCDIFILKCVYADRRERSLVIPYCDVVGKKQISIGKSKSKYYLYENKYEYIDMYEEFYKKVRSVNG